MELSKFSKLLEGKVVRIVDSPTEKEDIRWSSRGATGSLNIGDYDTNGGNIVVRFTDGSYILVWASEWGGIQYKGVSKK